MPFDLIIFLVMSSAILLIYFFLKDIFRSFVLFFLLGSFFIFLFMPIQSTLWNTILNFNFLGIAIALFFVTLIFDLLKYSEIKRHLRLLSRIVIRDERALPFFIFFLAGLLT